MHFSVSRTPNGAKAHLCEEINISTVTEDKNHLVQLLKFGGELELDLQGVTEIDTAGVQVLAALRKEAASLGVVCRLFGSGENVLDAFGRLGLAHLLDEPMVGSGVRHGS